MKTKDINMKQSQSVAKIDLGTKAQAVGKVRSTVDAIKANPDFATKPEVQAATTALSNAADAVDNNQKALVAIRTQEKALLTSQLVLVAALKRSVTSIAAVVSETEAGSAEGIKKWGLDVAGRQPTPATTTPPDGLRATYTKALALVIRWTAVRGARGYEVQLGDGTPQGWGQAIHATRSRFVPAGLVPGQHVVVRVAVHRSAGLSDYSDPLVLTVR